MLGAANFVGEIAMPRRLRTTLALCLTVGVLFGPSAASGTRSAATDGIVTLQVSDLVTISHAAATGTAIAAQAACNDGTYRVDGPRWTSTYRWYFSAATTPTYMARGSAESAVQRGIANIVTGRNDCGLPDRVNARARYLGRTSVAPGCKRSDGRNVVGFRSLPDGVAGRACWWIIGNTIVEADIQIAMGERWATARAGCFNQLMLEAVVTHEAGHAFGLGHVGERRHGRLTMSTYIDGPCNNQESTLGLGDLRGLEALYP
jgi:hypothetical protein